MNMEKPPIENGEKGNDGNDENNFQETMKDVVFDAKAAKEMARRAQEEKAAQAEAAEKQARLKKEAEEEEVKRRREEYEEKRKLEIQKHNSGWEAQKEQFDYPKEIKDTFMTTINGKIKEAAENGEGSVDFTQPVVIDYGNHDDLTRHSTVSLLTGKEIAEEGKSYDYGHIRKDYSAAIDKIIEGDPSRSEYDKEIRKEGEKVMPGLKELYEQQGYRVQVDKRGVITSISWGEEPEKPSEEKQQPVPQEPQSLRSRLKGLFS